MGLSKSERKFLKNFVKKAKKAKAQTSSRRDPAWYGEPRRHAKAAKKGWKKRGKSRRDPALYRSPLLRGKKSTRASAVHPWYTMRDPSWYGHTKAHAKAATKGHNRFKRAHGRDYPTSAQARRAGKAAHRDPALYRSPLLKSGRRTARTGAAHPWYMAHPR